MKKKQIYALAATLTLVGAVCTTGLVSKASDVREYTDKHGNRVIEYLNPVDPGNEPATMPDELPSNIGAVQGDLMTAEEPAVAQDTTTVNESTDQTTSEDYVFASEAGKEILQLDEDDAWTDYVNPDGRDNPQYVAEDIIIYTDSAGNKVLEYLNPVDPGNEPATMPESIPSTEGNVQGDIMTADEPIR